RRRRQRRASRQRDGGRADVHLHLVSAARFRPRSMRAHARHRPHHPGEPMTLPESLVAAIGVFRELGWAEADDGDIMDLPLGTTEQRRIAKAGLSKGAWGGIEQLSENSWGWRNRVGVDADMLGAFAVRVGVSARRAAEIFPRRLPAEQQGALLAERGAVFV